MVIATNGNGHGKTNGNGKTLEQFAGQPRWVARWRQRRSRSRPRPTPPAAPNAARSWSATAAATSASTAGAPAAAADPITPATEARAHTPGEAVVRWSRAGDVAVLSGGGDGYVVESGPDRLEARLGRLWVSSNRCRERLEPRGVKRRSHVDGRVERAEVELDSRAVGPEPEGVHGRPNEHHQRAGPIVQQGAGAFDRADEAGDRPIDRRRLGPARAQLRSSAIVVVAPRGIAVRGSRPSISSHRGSQRRIRVLTRRRSGHRSARRCSQASWSQSTVRKPPTS